MTGLVVGSATLILLIDFVVNFQTVKERFIAEALERVPVISYIASSECAYEKITDTYGVKAIENYLEYRERKKEGARIKAADKAYELAFKTLLVFNECSTAKMIDKYTRRALNHIHPFSKPNCNIFHRKELAPNIYSMRCRITNLINIPVVLRRGTMVIKSKLDGIKLTIRIRPGFKFNPKGTIDKWMRIEMHPDLTESFGLEKNYALQTDIYLIVRDIYLNDATAYSYP